MEEIKTKICKQCEQEKSINEFTKSKNVKDGYENKCKVCRLNNKKKFKNTCIICGKVFSSTVKDTKYCSYDCMGEARKERFICNCDFCGKQIEVANNLASNNLHYCNQACRTQHLKILMLGEGNPNYNRVSHKCDGCGKEIEVIPSKIENQKHVFCSNECYLSNVGKYYLGENNHNYVEYEYRQCDECGVEIKRKPGQFSKECSKNFCSSICSNRYYGKIKNTNEKTTCGYCGKEIFRRKSHIENRKFVYCSKECQNKHQGTIYYGEFHPNYNPNISQNEREIGRKYHEYIQWRKQVYERDNYTCQCCGDDKGGNLNAHHINGYNWYEEGRTDVNNGIVLCEKCHKEYHSIYGYGDNTMLQYFQFMANKKMLTHYQETVKINENWIKDLEL